MVVSLSSRDFFPPLYLDPRFHPLLLKFISCCFSKTSLRICYIESFGPDQATKMNLCCWEWTSAKFFLLVALAH